MEKDVQERIRKLQLIEENLHNYLGQKQQVQSQLMELESALAALDGAEKAHQIIGNVMVEQPAEVIRNDVEERAERLKTRIGAFDKQEAKLKKEAEALQAEIMKGVKRDDDG